MKSEGVGDEAVKQYGNGTVITCSLKVFFFFLRGCGKVKMCSRGVKRYRSRLEIYICQEKILVQREKSYRQNPFTLDGAIQHCSS